MNKPMDVSLSFFALNLVIGPTGTSNGSFGVVWTLAMITCIKAPRI